MASELQPSSDQVIEKTHEEAGWIIRSRWWGSAGNLTYDGPREVVIQLCADAPPEVCKRGIDQAVLHRLESQLSHMTVEFHEIPSVGAYQVMVRRYIDNRLADLPDGPRKAEDGYYAGLLDIFEDLTGRGHPEPLKAMALAMGIPENTVKTRLRVAPEKAGGTAPDSVDSRSKE